MAKSASFTMTVMSWSTRGEHWCLPCQTEAHGAHQALVKGAGGTKRARVAKEDLKTLCRTSTSLLPKMSKKDDMTFIRNVFSIKSINIAGGLEVALQQAILVGGGVPGNDEICAIAPLSRSRKMEKNNGLINVPSQCSHSLSPVYPHSCKPACHVFFCISDNCLSRYSTG